jgi:hypothetical protein
MGTKRPHCRRDWDKDLRILGETLGFEVLAWDGYPAKRNKVLIKCAHGERWVFPNGQINKTHCCRVSSKEGRNNPFFKKPTWNAGTKGVSTGHGYGHKPRGEEIKKTGRLYLVGYDDGTDNIVHFKIGITKHTIKKRLKTKLSWIVKGWELPLGKCFEIEQSTLRYASERGYRYSSSTTTELIRPEGLTSIIEYIDNLIDAADVTPVSLTAPSIG